MNTVSFRTTTGVESDPVLVVAERDNEDGEICMLEVHGLVDGAPKMDVSGLLSQPQLLVIRGEVRKHFAAQDAQAAADAAIDAWEARQMWGEAA